MPPATHPAANATLDMLEIALKGGLKLSCAFIEPFLVSIEEKHLSTKA
jgi:hypothetical protein